MNFSLTLMMMAMNNRLLRINPFNINLCSCKHFEILPLKYATCFTILATVVVMQLQYL